MKIRFLTILVAPAVLAGGLGLDAVFAAVSPSEDALNDAWCASVGGEREVRHWYRTQGGERGYIRVDCETGRHAVEGGKDKRSSLDSIQQAVFAAVLTGKLPKVVIYDTDGRFGRYEHRIWSACRYLGLAFEWVALGDPRT